MNKTKLIIGREYMTRVKKKSFIVMSFLGPVLMAAIFVIPMWVATMEDTDIKTIAVIDDSQLFNNKLKETEYIKFEYLKDKKIPEVKKTFEESGHEAVLYIGEDVLNDKDAVQLFSDKQPGATIKSQIRRGIKEEVERIKLNEIGVDKETYNSIKTSINVRTIQWTDEGEDKEGSTELASAVGTVGGMLLYFFILMFGMQVMRGIIEEKNNRIVEIIISSARPFQLMMGKIVGIAAVALTQLLIWIVLTTAIVTVVIPLAFPDINPSNSKEIVSESIMSSSAVDQIEVEDIKEQSEIAGALEVIQGYNFIPILISFIFYFLGGFLLYGSLYAAVGSAVDNETDTQQFMIPLTIPIVLSIYVMINAVQNPDSAMAVWFSIIPFTSPIVMLARIPFDPPTWQIILSVVLLILTFLGTTWLAGRIYRTGILMYGKKVTYKDLGKWIRYKF